jgi:hypothetical protein
MSCCTVVMITNKAKPECLEKYLPHCHFVYLISDIYFTGVKPAPPQWKAAII